MAIIRPVATVVLTAEAREDMRRLPIPVATRVRKLLVRLEGWPAVSGVKRLTGNLAGRYRVRTGDYRVQFRVENLPRKDPEEGQSHRVVVERIGHRDGFYGE